MPDSFMYREDAYVVLESNSPEEFLTPAEMLAKLETVLRDYQGQLSPDMEKYDSITDRARYLMQTACEFTPEPGKYLQWYVVRLEK